MGGVDQNARADGVSFSRQSMDRLDEAGDVRRAAHRQQGDAIAECLDEPVHVVFVEPSVAGDPGSHELGSPAPGQVVRVMFHPGREHDVPPAEWVAIGELVDGFRRVLPEDDRIGALVGADEPGDRFVRLIVGSGTDPRFESGAAVNARVIRQKLVDGVEHLLQWRCGGGVVEVDVWGETAVGERDLLREPGNSLSPADRVSEVWGVHAADRDRAGEPGKWTSLRAFGH